MKKWSRLSRASSRLKSFFIHIMFDKDILSCAMRDIHYCTNSLNTKPLLSQFQYLAGLLRRSPKIAKFCIDKFNSFQCLNPFNSQVRQHSIQPISTTCSRRYYNSNGWRRTRSWTLSIINQSRFYTLVKQILMNVLKELTGFIIFKTLTYVHTSVTLFTIGPAVKINTTFTIKNTSYIFPRERSSIDFQLVHT